MKFRVFKFSACFYSWFSNFAIIFYNDPPKSENIPVETTFWCLEEASDPWTIIVINIVRSIKLVQDLNAWGIIREVGIGGEIHNFIARDVLP